jgi:ABC-type spermidine/putrescine transport system permease subunit II
MTLTWPVRLGLLVVAAFVVLALYGPLLLTVFFSFFTLRRGAVQWDSFGLDWYAKLFHNAGIGEALANSLIVGFCAVALSLVLGTIFAFNYHEGRGPARKVQQLVIFLPFLMPPIITGLALLIFFRQVGIDRSLLTVVIGHTVFVLALVYRTILTRLQALSRSLAEASSDLGASRWQTFFWVLLPNLRTALVSAAVLAFALSFDETLITLLVTGHDNTLPIRLWAMMRIGFTPDINALVTLVLAGTTTLCLITVRFFRIA